MAGGSMQSPRWRRRDILVAAFVLAFLAAQVALPVAMFTVRSGVFGFDEEPRTGELPFSWQMFTIVPNRPKATVTFRDGSTGTVDLVELLGSEASRLDYDDSGRHAACAAIPDAASITVDVRGSRTTRC
jgi:hypothetical protein